jgi:hypothetical protein
METLARKRRTVKKSFKNILELKKSISKPSERWLDYVKYDLKKMAVRGWKKHIGIKMRIT